MVLIVLIFKSSGALAAAYGIAVTGVMVIDTFNASLVARQAMALGAWLWRICLFGAMGISDLIFFIANSLKIPEGGWLPLAHRRRASSWAWTPGGAAAACIWKKCAANPCR